MPIKIVSLNVNSIVHVGRKTLLTKFIADNPADIYLFQETKLDSYIKLFFPNFNILRGDIRRGYGGTAIFVRHGIPIRNVSIGRSSINFTSCEIKLDHDWHRISSVYVSHGSSNISLSYSSIFNHNSSSFFGGDFNSRHTTFGDISSNQYGLSLVDACNFFNLKIINPPSPTCFHSNSGSFIDKFISQNFSIPTSNISIIPSFSDHSAISIDLYCDSFPAHIPTKKVKNFHLTPTEPLNRFISRHFDTIPLNTHFPHTNDELDSIADRIETVFQSAVDRIVPHSFPKSHTVVLSFRSRAIQLESKRLQRLLFQAGPHLNSAFFNSIKNKIRLLRTMLQNSINSDTSKFFADLYDSVLTTRDSFKLIKKYTGLKPTSSPSSGIFTDDSRTTLLTQDSIVAEALASQFQSNHNLTCSNPSPCSLPVAIDNYLISNIPPLPISPVFPTNLLSNNDLISVNRHVGGGQSGLLTSVEEVSSIILSTPNKKSSGRDSMPYFLFKRFSIEIITFLTIFFNHCIANSHFPSAWKHSLITPIPKPNKDSSLLANWRPISQLSCVSKIFEKIIMARIVPTIQRLPILQNQFGFLAGHSTEHALCLLQSDIDDGLNNGLITSILGIDLRAAFDLIWHDALIHKMCTLGFNLHIIKLIKSMLSGRTFSVRLNDYISHPLSMPAGVPQGSVSGPVLFNLYLHDLPSHHKLKCIQFADDTSFYYTHKNPGFAQFYFNSHLETLNTYFNDWKMVLNHSKTEFINILGFAKDTNPTLRKKARNIKITSNGTLIKISDNIRFLGLQLQTNNRFIKHIDNRLTKARYAKFKLTRFFKRIKIPSKVRSTIYKMYVRPIITYASPAWCRPPNISSHQMERLRCFERGILRSTTGSVRPRGTYRYPNASSLYADASCLRIDRFVANRHLNFFNKLSASPNEKFAGILAPRSRGSGTYPPIDLIYAMHNDGQLVINDRMSLFNKRYNGLPGPVYSLNQ